MLQPHEGSSETRGRRPAARSGSWLQPHEGSSETIGLPEGAIVAFELQPHEGSSETGGVGDNGRNGSGFNPTRVRLKLA